MPKCNMLRSYSPATAASGSQGCRNVHAPPHLIPTAWVTCRAKGWRTSEHNTTAKINKMILEKSTSSGIFTSSVFLDISLILTRISLWKAMLEASSLRSDPFKLTFYIIVRHYLTTWPWTLGRRQHVSHEKCSPQIATRIPVTAGSQRRNATKSLKHASFVSVAMPPALGSAC